MDNTQSGMVPSDYLIIFISIIFAYVVSEFLSGWGELLRNRYQIKIYWLHLAWTIFIFVVLIECWWAMFLSKKAIDGNILKFCVFLIIPILFYMISVLLFPNYDTQGKEQFDLKEYFYQNNKSIFSITLLIVIFMFIDSKLYNNEALFSLGNLFRVCGMIVLIIGMFCKNEIIHILLMIMAWFLFANFIYFCRFNI